jgi:hypothetical protein
MWLEGDEQFNCDALWGPMTLCFLCFLGVARTCPVYVADYEKRKARSNQFEPRSAARATGARQRIDPARFI